MYKLKGKAENLDILSKIFQNKNVVIPKYFYFTVAYYKTHRRIIVKKIKQLLVKKKIILRSSSKKEDQSEISNAGKYSSMVLKSYLNELEILKILDRFMYQFSSTKDKIIVQELISEVNYSGVIFTKDINYNSPYFIINYDNTGKTNLVTSGVENKTQKTLIIYKNSKIKNEKFKKLIVATKKIEALLKYDRLDIEFAYKKNKIYLFQVRKLPKIKNTSSISNYTEKKFESLLINIEKKIKKLKSINPFLEGNNTLFSNMADWNPAEMIGDKPYPLAVSIYKELITDKVWREQRKIYGYKNVFPNPLMFTFAGSPYIDLRADIISFLPAKLNKKQTKTIVNKLIVCLQKNPDIHDKIEFELIETCYSFNSKKRLKQNFSKKLINIYLKHLKILTKEIINKDFISIEENKIKIFKNEISKISKQKLSNIQKIYYYSEITKKYGTLPFAGLARCAFISQRLLLDLKELNYISNDEFNNFFKSIDSVTSIFNKDYLKLINNKITKSYFLNKYGHLRPSTYDINSLNYKEGFNVYFKSKKKTPKNIKSVANFKNQKKIDVLFKSHLGINLNKFILFAHNSIFLREYSKLVFSESVNLILENLIELGQEINISRNDLSFLNFNNILNFYSKLEVVKLKKALNEEIQKNKYEYEMMKLIKLPDLIKNEKNIYQYYENLSKPNFITLNSVVGEICEMDKKKNKILKDKIVFIKNADPGFDFIFNYGIKALVTQYGGANSHMAIRCLELNIPAAIGLGKSQYDKLKIFKKILINCKNKEIKIIK